MKLPTSSLSKSIHSPGRARDPPLSLPTSLSRRLRTNGSVRRGQASPMFHTTNKKRGSGFENPEPSSPKVTCIGQVRVKSKKKKQQQQQQIAKLAGMRSLSRRHGGEGSLRRLDRNPGSGYQDCLRNQNQRWVHLPVTICEALRAFGSEFSCLFPCRSSCFSATEKREGAVGSGDGAYCGAQSSCGAILRWLVAVEDGEGGGGRREIELVVGGGDDEEHEEADYEETPARSSRRHVFEDLRIVGDRIEAFGGGGGEEAAPRVSICIPPKNALLLMRCRSDPNKVEALSNRLWEPSVPTSREEEEEEEDDEERLDVKLFGNVKLKDEGIEKNEPPVEGIDVKMKDDDDEMVLEEEKETQQQEGNLETEIEHSEGEIEILEESLQISDEGGQEEHEQTQLNLQSAEFDEESLGLEFLFEEVVDQEYEEDEDEQFHEYDSLVHLFKEDEQERVFVAQLGCSSGEEDMPSDDRSKTPNGTPERSSLLEETQEESGRDSTPEKECESLHQEELKKETRDEKQSRMVLPDCLLLMMYEPKLSMEVSKETWVCSTDFVRRQPEKKKQNIVKPINDEDDHANRKLMISNARTDSGIPAPPRRSCCSFPAPSPPPSMATMIEQKLVNAVGYEPFVLTRCKSEPMRTAAAKLVPETCFWKNRKLEPLRRAAAFGFGAAGVGY